MKLFITPLPKLPRLIRYGFLSFIIVIACILTSPVIAKNTSEQVITTQENQAQILYTEGRFAESITLLKQAL
ncbi:MAG: hypothetical protein ACKPE3_21465, partial [Sphaerospermopsis kisseleviana]